MNDLGNLKKIIKKIIRKNIPYNIPSGGIIMWSGSINKIPSGWILCNGQNNTPDLQDKFIYLSIVCLNLLKER